jgi:hypothetical protein
MPDLQQDFPDPRPFGQWWRELRAIADADPDGDAAGNDQESFREMYDDGLDPKEAYDAVWEDFRR